MPTIPPFMLKQLYIKGSLQNTATGFTLTLRNHLAPASLVGMGLAVDNTQVDPAALTVVVGATRTVATAITPDTPLRFETNTPTAVEAQAAPLAPGAHKLTLLATTREIGPVTIDVTDTIQQ
jgi:hypothetical protein